MKNIRFIALSAILCLFTACGENNSQPLPVATPQTEYAQFVFMESSLGCAHSDSTAVGTFLSHTMIGDYSFLSIDQISIDKENTQMAPSMLSSPDNPRMFNQNGVYRIVVGVDGDSLVIDNFKYSGENNICVAKGCGWGLYLTKDPWLNMRDKK